MLSCSIWFSAPSFSMGGGLESRCVGRVYGADGAVRRTLLMFKLLKSVRCLCIVPVNYTSPLCTVPMCTTCKLHQSARYCTYVYYL